MSPLDNPLHDHEFVAVRRDRTSGLQAIVAIHNRNLGPAIGGCRIQPYASWDAALADALRLSRGMTYKCAISGIPYGGGKAVIIADPASGKTRAKLHAMGDFVESLRGDYITSFDAGATMDDVRLIGERTRFVGGVEPGVDNASASTALGVFNCMLAAWQMRYGKSLADVRVAIQGAGNVGSRLAALLADAGAQLTVADQDPAKAELVAAACRASVVGPEMIAAVDADIFAPCALGAVLNEASIPRLRAAMVCGGANNQLATVEDDLRLQAAGILYCPDFLTNAGGIVDLHHQRIGRDHAALAAHLTWLGTTMQEVIRRSQREGRTTTAVAEQMAEARFRKAGP